MACLHEWLRSRCTLGVGGDTFTQVIAISSLVEIFGSEAAEMLPIAMRTELL